jgi:exopolyphosphatase/guanosine-5'-triphosphate,3'-diphosphate pyrophosphatase
MKIVGAIDIGSNAIRMVCARLTDDRRIELIEKYRTSVRLGEDVFGQGYLSEETITRLSEALRVYHRTLQQNGATEVCAYSTSAIRETANQEEVIERLEQETGIRLETISGGQEASLLQRAVGRVVDIHSGEVLMADLGGGSLEVSLLVNGEIEFAESFRLGTVRLLKMFPYTPAQEKVFLRWAKSYVKDFMSYIKTRAGWKRLDQVIVTGGNATALGKFAAQHVEGTPFEEGLCTMDRPTFLRVKKLLLQHDLRGREEALGLSTDRSDVILPAVLIFDQLMQLSGAKVLHIPAVGLRDGILDEMLERAWGDETPSAHEQIMHSAWHYARRYGTNLQHSETVRKLSLQLFDGTWTLHHLGTRDRTLLEVAAVLHDIGRFIRPSDHPQHSMYLIQNAELVGLTNTERQMVALVARYHTSGTPSTKERQFGRLSLEQRHSVTGLTALLRVADALDRQHEDLVPSLYPEVSPRQVQLLLKGTEDLMLAEWALKRKKKLFEKTFKRTLEVASLPEDPHQA